MGTNISVVGRISGVCHAYVSRISAVCQPWNSRMSAIPNLLICDHKYCDFRTPEVCRASEVHKAPAEPLRSEDSFEFKNSFDSKDSGVDGSP